MTLNEIGFIYIRYGNCMLSGVEQRWKMRKNVVPLCTP